jgi:LemA protein
MTVILIIVIGIPVLLILWAIVTFNRMVTLRNSTESAWSDIDVLLRKRYDLIPNLVATVKGYTKHESETLERVIQARNQAINIKADDVQKQIEAENMLTQTLRSVYSLTESYPDLKADKQFNELMEQLQQIETEIERSRRYYNAVVRDYNNATQMFPGAIIAGMGGFVKKPYYEIESVTMREGVKVEF